MLTAVTGLLQRPDGQAALSRRISSRYRFVQASFSRPRIKPSIFTYCSRSAMSRRVGPKAPSRSGHDGVELVSGAPSPDHSAKYDIPNTPWLVHRDRESSLDEAPSSQSRAKYFHSTISGDWTDQEALEGQRLVALQEKSG